MPEASVSTRRASAVEASAAELLQDGEPGRRGERVPRQRPCLVDGAGGASADIVVRVPSDGGERQSAADHLAEAVKVGADAVEPGGAVAPRRKPVITSSKIKSAPT